MKDWLNKNRTYILLLIILVLLAGGVLSIAIYRTELLQNQVYKNTTFLMGTVVSETVYGGDMDCIQEINTLLNNLEQQYLSWRAEDSMVAYINTSKTMKLSGDFKNWMIQALALAEVTDGAFDPTLRPLIVLWGIEEDAPSVPQPEEISECLSHIGYEKVSMVGDVLNLPEDMSLDLGAVGKGIALDVLEAYFQVSDSTAATVAVGGSILTYQNKKSGAWKIAVQDPAEGPDTPMGILTLTGTNYISTSGDYEKYFVEDGISYHHIFDRDTGYPAVSGLHSVTVVCDNGLVSDGLSTACFVLGYENSLPVLAQYDAEAVFIFEDNTVAVTEGLRNCFELQNQNYRLR